jgi:hypothetical protein
MTIVARMSVASILAIGFLGFATPSFATNTSQALKLCRANPSCHSRVGEHSVIMTINGQDAVECPKLSTGQCIVVRTAPSQHDFDALGDVGTFSSVP